MSETERLLFEYVSCVNTYLTTGLGSAEACNKARDAFLTHISAEDARIAMLEAEKAREELAGYEDLERAMNGKMDLIKDAYEKRIEVLESQRAIESEVFMKTQKHLLDAFGELCRLRLDAERLQQIVDDQAEDEGLWFVAKTAPEAYLQQELRKLHAAIEAARGSDE